MDLSIGNGYMLNPFLVNQLGLTEEDVAELKRLHLEKDRIFAEARKAGPENPKLLDLSDELKEIEYAMQRTWGFSEEEARHTWRFLMPNSPFYVKAGSWAAEYLAGRLPAVRIK